MNVPEDTTSSAKLRASELRRGLTRWLLPTLRGLEQCSTSPTLSGDCKPSEWNKVRPQLAIIPSERGELLTASQLLLAPEGTGIPGRATVATTLYNDANARRILVDVMKVQAPDEKVWEQVLGEFIRTIPYYPLETRDAGWKNFWVRLRQAPEVVRGRFIQHHQNQIYVRRRNGTWVLADDILLPGALIEPDDTSANQNILVDDAVHGWGWRSAYCTRCYAVP